MSPNTRPGSSAPPCQVVGIGASAGGLESLERFFHAVSPAPGMAFVVVQHLSPDFRSVMDELIGRFTALPVRRAEDGMEVEPDTVYVLPPAKEMTLADGHLHLTDKDPAQPLTLPIDHFFRSLAHESGPMAAAVVMSGSGSDGSRGVRDVHDAGGFVLAESEETARFDGMPGSARRSGIVDRVLPPEEMPKALLHWAQGIGAEDEEPAQDRAPLPAMDGVLELLRRDYDVDFSHYKPTTVERRIGRRLTILGIESLEEYVGLLRRQPAELDALYSDLLIGVTSFFRDPHCFQRLQEVLPRVVAAKQPNEELRIWVAGCATGEEAYSLAILADEGIRQSGRPVGLKVFATDVNARLLETAGRGVYGPDRLANVEPHRLARYFVRREDGFQVVPGLRQAMVFAAHNLLRDAPFTNLDLVACRNLLIYLLPQAQKKALLVFHFGLRAGGVLFLGSSEAPGGLEDQFETVDARCRLHINRRDVRLATDFDLPVPGGRLRPDTTAERAGRADTGLLRTYGALLDREGLRSTNEELHSVNEELHTVNAEYQRKIQELSELNRDMNHLLEATDVATLFLDRDLRVRRFTPRIAGIFDLVGSDIGRPIASFTPRITHPALLDELREVLQDGRLREQEVHGDAGAYLLRVLPYRDGDSIEGVVLSLVDVTVLERARRDLSRLSAIVQSTDDAIIGKSTTGMITSWNAGAEQLYGFTAEEAIGRPLSLCVPPERLAETEDALNRVLRGERLAHYESMRVRKNGEVIDVSVRVSPVLDDTGAVVGASSISRDITGRKRTERRLQAERAVARLAAEASSFEETAPRLGQALRESLGVDVVEFYLPDAKGGMTPVSGTPVAAQPATTPVAAQPATTAAADGVKSISAAPGAVDVVPAAGDLAPAPLPLDAAWPEQARQSGRALWFSEVAGEQGEATPGGAVRLGYRSGLAFPIVRGHDCLAVIVIYCRGPLPPAPELMATVAVIGQTIGQLIRRWRAESELRADVTRRDRFLAMLSHELRNPLAAARAAVIALQRNHLNRDERHAAYDVIARQVQHMSHLLDDLLDVARVTQDRLKLQSERFDLSEAISAAVEMVAPVAGDREVAVEVDGLKEPAPVAADRARITQMLGNLLTNAVKYSPPRSGVRLTASQEGGEAVIRVVDRGVGMTRDVLEHAFDMFYQADETLDRRQSGMGVGLTLARTIAALHGGRLTASSAGAGQGSTFEVRLPIAQALPREAPAERHTSGRSYRIVLVEDHEDNREMIRLLLGCEGHRVDVAADGAEGVSLIEQVKPDVALVDLGLPGIDGFAVAQRIRENRALDEVGLIALSGYAQASDVEHARRSGFDAHVAKPMTPEDLLDVVASVVKDKDNGQR